MKEKRRYFVVLDVERNEDIMLDRAQVAETVAAGIDYITPGTLTEAVAYRTFRDLVRAAVRHEGPFSD